MRSDLLFQTLALLLTLNSSPVVATKDPAPFKDEHPGQVFNGGKPTGQIKEVNEIDMYLSYPPKRRGPKGNTETAILYLTDIFGIPLVNNKLLGDSLANAGYFVVMPDLFDGEPVPVDAMGTPGWNMTAWRERHTPDMVDAIVESTIASMRGELGVKRIGAVGYCFGGKYVTRFLTPGRGLDAGFTAHPSGVVATEWEGISSPISIAFGELDGSSTPAQRAAAEGIFQAQNKTFQTSLYSNAEHGFAVRTNLTDPEKKFAQEGAYWQAVRWVDAWVKTA